MVSGLIFMIGVQYTPQTSLSCLRTHCSGHQSRSQSFLIPILWSLGAAVSKTVIAYALLVIVSYIVINALSYCFGNGSFVLRLYRIALYVGSSILTDTQ